MSLKVELFAPVLEWLDAGAPHIKDTDTVFNMNYFKAKNMYSYNDADCGTACCIAGALVQFNNLDQDFDQNSPINSCLEVGKQVGMSKEQVYDLFLGQDLPYPMDRITPNMAANAIRSMLSTGYADWPEELDE